MQSAALSKIRGVKELAGSLWGAMATPFRTVIGFYSRCELWKTRVGQELSMVLSVCSSRVVYQNVWWMLKSGSFFGKNTAGLHSVPLSGTSVVVTGPNRCFYRHSTSLTASSSSYSVPHHRAGDRELYKHVGEKINQLVKENFFCLLL